VLGTSLDTATQQASARTLYDSYQRPPAAAERATVMAVEVKEEKRKRLREADRDDVQTNTS
jgi:hypothetical protein